MSLFVTFEGPEGSGKSTQVARMTAALESDGYDVVATREPGGTPLGERVRDLLLTANDYAIVPRTEALLMTAARAQHFSEVILPALQRGAIVLCDRFTDSTLAYQGAGRGLSYAELEQLQTFAVGDYRSDLTILLDLPVEVGLSRREQSGTPLNRLDQDELAFHQRVREWYVHAAQHEPDRWLVFDATLGPDELAELILRQLRERVPKSVEEPSVNEAGE